MAKREFYGVQEHRVILPKKDTSWLRKKAQNIRRREVSDRTVVDTDIGLQAKQTAKYMYYLLGAVGLGIIGSMMTTSEERNRDIALEAIKKVSTGQMTVEEYNAILGTFDINRINLNPNPAMELTEQVGQPVFWAARRTIGGLWGIGDCGWKGWDGDCGDSGDTSVGGFGEAAGTSGASGAPVPSTLPSGAQSFIADMDGSGSATIGDEIFECAPTYEPSQAGESAAWALGALERANGGDSTNDWDQRLAISQQEAFQPFVVAVDGGQFAVRCMYKGIQQG